MPVHVHLLRIIRHAAVALVATNAFAQNDGVSSQDEITIVLSESVVTSVSASAAGASTKEEAARIFASNASRIVGQAVADVVAKLLAKAVAQTASPSIVGWEDYVISNGLVVELHWPSPGLSAGGSLPVTVYLGGENEDMTVVINGDY